MRKQIITILGVLGLCVVALGADAKKKVAVLPFVGGSDAEKALAEKMRFAVGQKWSANSDVDRMDSVQVDQVISALGLTWGATGEMPGDEDIGKVIEALGIEEAVVGQVKGRQLTLELHEAGGKKMNGASVEIPSSKESPRLAVEKAVTEVTGAQFTHIREAEVDHSDAAAEKRFAARPNLVENGDFGQTKSTAWVAVLGSDEYNPPFLVADDLKRLKSDQVAIVPKAVAGVKGDDAGNCLLMRMTKGVAESNGLACVSTWIDVEQGKKYRFTVKYHSEGPVARLFLKGFAYKADQFGKKGDLEAVRREYYRAQVLPREKNTGWDLIEMDFTPESLKKTDPKVEWMRLDLWVYLKPGDIFFDDVVLKKLDE